MDKEFYYSTVAGTSAVMRIHGDIGFDVIGTDFVGELVALEEMGVTDITVRIMSGGGSVIDGFAIFSALLSSKAAITTVNEGLAASTAGWIFLAGKSAVMCDYALLMLHNPSSPDQSAKGLERVNFMRNSILTIFSKRTGTDMKALGNMMNDETWIDADKAVALGFATGIEETELMIELNPNAQTANQMYEICNSIMIKNEIVKMTTEENTIPEELTHEVTNEAMTEPQPENEPAPEAEVTNETTESESVAEVTETEAPVVDAEKDELVRERDELMVRLAAMETTLNSYKEAEAVKAQKERETMSLELVTNAVNLGKIIGEAKPQWMELANRDYAMAKVTLDAIQVTKTGVDILNKVKAGSPVTSGKKLRDLEKENPREVTRLHKEERAVYNQLYYEEYGKYPA